jgi:protocatechuate 3,4-dioxygenase beta subunit
LIVAVGVLVLSANAFAQETGWVAPASGTAVVRGRIVSAADGRTLARAQVKLTLKGGGVHDLVTDENGSFEFIDLPAGDYGLSATLPGYLTFSFGQTQPSDTPRTIRLKDGQVRSNLEIALPTGGVIEVHVTDESGAPVEGAFVQAQRPRLSAKGEFTLAPSVSDKQRTFGADDRGVLRLYDLAPGEYYVSATPPVVPGQPNSADHQNATGRLQTFHPGVVTLADAVPVMLGLGEEIRIDLAIASPYAAIQRPLNGAITVHVVDDVGNPRAGAEVRALAVTGEGTERTLTRATSTATSSPRFWETKDFYTDDRGYARIYGLPPGDYAVAASPLLGSVMDREHGDRRLAYVPIYFPGSPSRADAQVISVQTWDDVGLELAVTPAPAAQISGRVVRWDGDPGRTFVVLSRSSVDPLYPQGLITDALWRAEVVNGEFTFDEVFPGDYTIRASYDPDSDVRDGEGEIAITVDGTDVTDVILRTIRPVATRSSP